MKLLDDMTEWVKEVPLAPQANQRFGNLAFREYIALVEAVSRMNKLAIMLTIQRIPAYFEEPSIPKQLPAQLLPLLLNSNAFGHATRLDYGTGHELAFMLGLWCCVVSGWVGGEGKEDEEDEMILRVFARWVTHSIERLRLICRYLDLATLLQSTYKLEPAGSHGVWGLDDYCFLPSAALSF
jgi:serine/threonine-protein phosphatase 2A activator